MQTTRAILTALGLPTRAPPLAPARPVPSDPDWTLTEPSPTSGYVYVASGERRPAA